MDNLSEIGSIPLSPEGPSDKLITEQFSKTTSLLENFNKVFSPVVENEDSGDSTERQEDNDSSGSSTDEEIVVKKVTTPRVQDPRLKKRLEKKELRRQAEMNLTQDEETQKDNEAKDSDCTEDQNTQEILTQRSIETDQAECSQPAGDEHKVHIVGENSNDSEEKNQANLTDTLSTAAGAPAPSPDTIASDDPVTTSAASDPAASIPDTPAAPISPRSSKINPKSPSKDAPEAPTPSGNDPVALSAPNPPSDLPLPDDPAVDSTLSVATVSVQDNGVTALPTAILDPPNASIGVVSSPSIQSSQADSNPAEDSNTIPISLMQGNFTPKIKETSSKAQRKLLKQIFLKNHLEDNNQILRRLSDTITKDLDDKSVINLEDLSNSLNAFREAHENDSQAVSTSDTEETILDEVIKPDHKKEETAMSTDNLSDESEDSQESVILNFPKSSQSSMVDESNKENQPMRTNNENTRNQLNQEQNKLPPLLCEDDFVPLIESFSKTSSLVPISATINPKDIMPESETIKDPQLIPLNQPPNNDFDGLSPNTANLIRNAFHQGKPAEVESLTIRDSLIDMKRSHAIIGIDEDEINKRIKLIDGTNEDLQGLMTQGRSQISEMMEMESQFEAHFDSQAVVTQLNNIVSEVNSTSLLSKRFDYSYSSLIQSLNSFHISYESLEANFNSAMIKTILKKNELKACREKKNNIWILLDALNSGIIDGLDYVTYNSYKLDSYEKQLYNDLLPSQLNAYFRSKKKRLLDKTNELGTVPESNQIVPISMPFPTTQVSIPTHESLTLPDELPPRETINREVLSMNVPSPINQNRKMKPSTSSVEPTILHEKDGQFWKAIDNDWLQSTLSKDYKSDECFNPEIGEDVCQNINNILMHDHESHLIAKNFESSVWGYCDPKTQLLLLRNDEPALIALLTSRIDLTATFKNKKSL